MGGREDAASLDRPCARRLRDLAVGTEECSRRGSNQRMAPKRTRKLASLNRWFLTNIRLALTSLSPVRRELASDLPGSERAGAEFQVKPKTSPGGATPSECSGTIGTDPIELGGPMCPDGSRGGVGVVLLGTFRVQAVCDSRVLGGPKGVDRPKRPQGLLRDSLRGVSRFRWVGNGQPIKRVRQSPMSPGGHLRAR